MATRNAEVSRNSVVGICDSAGSLHGHGLLLGVSGVTAVLTCHHVLATLQPKSLRVALRSKPGAAQTAPVAVTFDAELSSPDRDAVVLRLQIEAPSVNPVLQHLDGRFYGGDLPKRAIGFSHNQAGTFAGSLGAAIPHLRLPVKPAPMLRLPFRHGSDGYPNAPADFYDFVYAFPLHDPTDAREGISGAPVFYEDGVIGLVHFTRKETADFQRESYVVPISVWADKWPELGRLIEPFTDGQLRARAIVKLASAVDAEEDLAIAGYVDAAYVARAADTEVRRMIGRPDHSATVMVVGKPKSGKTRLAFNLLSPDDLVVIPKAASPPDEWQRSGFHDRPVTLLLDDLHAKPAWEPMAWVMAIRSAGARRCHTIVTARDGEDLAQLIKAHGSFFESVGGDRAIVRTSGGESDFTEAEAKRLADMLGVAGSEARKRFDGTPGSLALDLSAMRHRYTRLRERAVGDVAQSRLLDSAKLLRTAFIPTLRADALRWVCETIRGNRSLSEEEWDALKRHTIEEGFGRFADDDGRFDIYTPYLDECVGYAPSVREIKALAPFLLDHGETVLPVAHALFFRRKDFDGGRALLENAIKRGVRNGKRDLAIFLGLRSANDKTTAKLLRQAIAESDGDNVEVMEALLGSCLVNQKGAEAECEKLLKKSAKGRFPNAYRDLARLYQRLPRRAQDAEQAFRDGIAAADDSGLRFMFNDFGVFLSNQKRYEEAAEEFRRGCAIGDRLACRNLCRCHLQTGAPIADPAVVLQWFEQCAPGEDLEMLASLLALGPTALAKRAYVGGIEVVSSKALFPLDVLLSGMGSVERLREAVAQGSPALAERGFIRAIEKGHPEALMPLTVLLGATGAFERLAEVVSAHLSRLTGELLRATANFIFTLSPRKEMFRLIPGAGGIELKKLINRGSHELPDQERLWPAAEILLRAAIQLGDRPSHLRIAVLLAQNPSRSAEAEAAYRDAIGAGSAEAYCALGHLIAQNRERWAEAETVYRAGIKANDRDSYRGLLVILMQTPGREEDVSHLAEEMVQRGILKLPIT